MPTDSELLLRYANAGSKEAFEELVRRYHRMVYFAALRKLSGDAHRAKEVAQDVFVDLGRKAASLARRPAIGGWLYISACYAAAKVARAAQRKRAAEEKAALANPLLALARENPSATELSPIVDEVLLQLNARDREAVILRFFQELTFPEMAAHLHLSEDGARLRLNRALEKMRSQLSRRGVASTAAALSGALASQAGAAVPPGLLHAVTAGALQKLSTGSGGILYLFTMTKSTTLAVGTVILIATIPAAYLLRPYYSSSRPSTTTDTRSAAQPSSGPNLAAQAPNASVSTAPAVAARNTGSATELATTANDPKSALMSDLSRGTIPIEALSNIGCATPRAAAESFFWAIAHGTNDDIAGMIGLSATQKSTLQSYLQDLPEAARAKYPDPEHVVALFAAREGTIIPATGNIQITSETLAAGDEVTLSTHITTSPAQYKSTGLVPENRSDLNLRNGPGGWKIVVPDEVISAIAPLVEQSASKG